MEYGKPIRLRLRFPPETQPGVVEFSWDYPIVRLEALETSDDGECLFSEGTDASSAEVVRRQGSCATGALGGNQMMP